MERPIIFSGPMVRAIIAGEKTQTRRVPADRFRRWRADDVLWVRESFACPEEGDGYLYRADFDDNDRLLPQIRWKPSIHMPREATRLRLIVEELAVERLWEIDDDGALAEGMPRRFTYPRDEFLGLWDGINGKRAGGEYAWAENPTVAVITFSRSIDGR